MPYPLDNALFQWEEGYRRLQELNRDPRLYGRLASAVDAVRNELRKRVGPTFTAAQLADLYAQGTDWCLEVARLHSPEEAADWDPQVISDAAFYLYLRGASDYSGGRLIPQE
jgi:hypothetical protein